MTELLSITGVGKSYPGVPPVRALADVTLTVWPGRADGDRRPVRLR